jgi:ABC-2 type transport system permease protein
MNKIIQYKQLFQLISAYFWETIREPGVLFWGIVFPMLMSLGLGIAFTQKANVVRNIAIVEAATAKNTMSTQHHLIDDFLKHTTVTKAPRDTTTLYKITIPDEKMGNTTFLFRKTTWQQAMVLLKRGNLSVVMTEQDDSIRYNFDPLNPDAQLTYLKLSRIIGPEGSVISQSNDNVIPLTVSGTRYIDFLVPGLIAMGVMMSSMWGLSYGIIEKRSKKLLRRMVATPMKKSHFLISMVTVRVGMNFIESAMLFLFAAIVFGITIQGSVAALLVVFLAGNIAFAGIAIFISSRTANTEIGNGYINVVVIPMMVLSGIFFSYHNFPDWAIPVIKKLPLTILADGLRGIFIEGAGFAGIAVPSFILLATGVVFFLIGLRVFKWH